MKKLSSLLLALVMMFGSVTFTSSAVPDIKHKLQFREDGTFKILQLSDIQDNLYLQPLTKNFINDLLDRTQPDLVVLTGDNIGPNKALTKRGNKRLIDNVMKIFEEREVRVAAVFGNHDAENRLSKDEQFDVYNEYLCFMGYEYEETKALSGCGTYNLPVMSGNDGSKTVFNLWFFDSQEYNEENDLGGYGCVQKDQIEWYEKTEAALTDENSGKPVPSLAFQHIIIPEIWDVLIKTGEANEEGEILTTTDDYVKEYSVVKNTAVYTLPEKYRGEDVFLSETPCPPEYSNGQVQSMIKNGNVLGIAVGHDHKNSFVIPYEGVDIIQTPTVGFGSYGDNNRGARVITLNEKDLSDYETEVIFFRDYYSTDDKAFNNRVIANNDMYSVSARLWAMVKWWFYSIF
ncbi:MAG: metallophosphoesterase [Clostridia bacterium]|nr:metallophosphoesterase [Clostridia bacterium]